MRGVATAFATKWLEAWNSHNLDRILALYEPDFEFSSPVLAKRPSESGGRLSGTEAARRYWFAAFAPGMRKLF